MFWWVLSIINYQQNHTWIMVLCSANHFYSCMMMVSYHSSDLSHSCSHNLTQIWKVKAGSCLCKQYTFSLLKLHFSSNILIKLLFWLYKSHKRLHVKASYPFVDVMRGKPEGSWYPTFLDCMFIDICIYCTALVLRGYTTYIVHVVVWQM